MRRIDCADLVFGIFIGLLTGVFLTRLCYDFLIQNGRYPYGEKTYICAEIVDE